MQTLLVLSPIYVWNLTELSCRWETAKHPKGLNQIHNTGLNGRENFLKKPVRNAVQEAVRRTQFLHYIG